VLRVDATDAANATSAADRLSPIEWYLAIDAVRQVAPPQADVVQWRVMGLDNAEIAAENGTGKATVKRDLKEARPFLAYRLDLPADWLNA
jgi:DNA-directed RNA polymerase specialized sigma24 family protein